MSYEVLILAILWAGLTLYVLLGGADFGGGVWDLLASGPTRERQRHLISEAIGPVWEANHVWLIFVLTGLLAAFPGVFADLSVALYLPFSLALLGIVFRGAAFAFRAHGEPGSAWQGTWTRVFGIASLISPVVLGAAAASIASGRIRVRGGAVEAGLVSAWTGPLSVFAGAFALAICAYLAATYLTAEAVMRGDRELEDVFRVRALAAGVVAGALAAAGLFVVRTEAPELWHGMTHRGLPFVVLSALGGLASLAATARRRYRWARPSAAIAVGAVLWGWGAAQWPHLIVPDVTAAEAAAPEATLQLVTVGFGIGALVLGPSLFALFRVFKTARSAGASHR
ncbi:MAG: cytochrome D ubiquinol oxidase subunit II [Actinomycetota bacterium]|nr:MAG: cytochrome D ubiquinol oxidase subunit II [Actinomycetota bacterium]